MNGKFESTLTTEAPTSPFSEDEIHALKMMAYDHIQEQHKKSQIRRAMDSCRIAQE